VAGWYPPAGGRYAPAQLSANLREADPATAGGVRRLRIYIYARTGLARRRKRPRGSGARSTWICCATIESFFVSPRSASVDGDSVPLWNRVRWASPPVAFGAACLSPPAERSCGCAKSAEKELPP
jgi:hypothetical protein